MKTSRFVVFVWLAFAGLVVAQDTPANVFESLDKPVPAGELDRIVFAKLAALDIEPVLCSDAVFVRRVYLDVIGKLPTADEVRQFLDDPDTENKRRLLIDRLLERKEFADYWSMKWSDVLRIKAEFPVNLWPNAAQAYHRWVRASIAENKPYDQFVREMLTSSGSNFRVGPVNFYRAIQNKTPEGIAATVALTFMGSRTDSWPEGRLEGTAVFFSQIGYKPTSEWKEEVVFWDPLNSRNLPGNSVIGRDTPGTAPPKPAEKEEEEAAPEAEVTEPQASRDKALVAVFPDGAKIDLPPDRDPRAVFADWLIAPVLVGAAICHPARRSSIRPLPAAATGCRGLDRRHQPDHGHHRFVHQRDPRTVHVHPARHAGGCVSRWQHQQPVPHVVRPFGARHGHGE